ncbi:MAG: hypothetical protein ACUVXE_07390 [Anaerolineae bacterium]
MKGFLQKRLWITALLAGGLSALALSWALAAPHPALLHIATNLSNQPSRPSYYPDIAVSPDGDRVVVVWPEAYEDGGSAPKGSVYLRWASESIGSGWSPSVTIHTGSPNECAHWAAVAVTGTNPYTAHIAYATKAPCNNPTTHYIRYRTCVLGGTCSTPSAVVTRSLGSNDPGIGSVDIALDGEGQPHIVYAYYAWNSSEIRDVGTVYYRSPQGWEEEVSSGGNARNPAIAWGDGAAHIAWATEPLQGQTEYFIYYRRLGQSPQPLIKQTLSYAPHDPAIAVFSRTVMAVWDMNNALGDSDCATNQSECDLYTIAYIRSTDGGQTWPLAGGTPQWYEVGGGQWGTYRPYTSTGAIVEYLRFLRPSVGFRADGKPVMVWHVNRGTTENPDYDLYYTYALTVPESAGEAIEWAEIGPYGQNLSGNAASPVVAPFLASEALHVVYLQNIREDWETYYDGNEYQNYPHVYLPLVMRNAR